MDATELDFRDNSFDSIICVEAAFHFDTREKFVREAYRVLKLEAARYFPIFLCRGGLPTNQKQTTQGICRRTRSYSSMLASRM